MSKTDPYTSNYQDIFEAKVLLGLPDHASMEEIKSNYRELIRKWYPDKCQVNHEKCSEMTRKIIDADNTIVTYCHQYTYSIEKEEVRKYLTDEEWWFEQFGEDPLWGNIDKKIRKNHDRRERNPCC